MALLPRLGILRRLAAPPRAAAARAGLLVALAVFERLGPRDATDAADLFGVAVLAAVLGTWLALDAAARGALARLGRRLGGGVKARIATFGVDLRGEPVVPRGAPLFLRRFAGLCAILTALELLWILGVGTPFRAFLARGSYALLLLVTGTLWAALLFAILFSVAIVTVVLGNVLRFRHGGRLLARRRARWLAGYLAVAFLGLALVPDQVALLALVLGVSLAGIAPAAPRLPMLWRDRDGRIGSLHLHQWLVAQALLVWWPVAIAIMGGLGGRAFGAPPGGTTPVSDALGACAAWFAGPAALLLAFLERDLMRAMLSRDPAAPCPTAVHVSPGESPGDERRARELLEARGWTVRSPPEPPAPADVRLRLVDRMPPLSGGVQWPLAVSAIALTAPELLDLIARRDVVQRRRLLLRGLERMLAHARRRAYAAGTGFWIAPHQWFAVGLTRDTSEDASDLVGEPYHLVIPRAALHHACRVFSAIEIDLVFVEDGVAWLDLRRVLLRLFGHCDARLGRIEERHVHGIPGIRVIVHDFRIGEPLGRARYPEPDYEDLGRARVLHVFRDRGGEDEHEPAPSSDEGVPLRA